MSRPIWNFEQEPSTERTDETGTNLRAYFRYSWFKTLTPADSLNNAESTFPGQPNGTQGGIRSGYSTGFNWTIKPTLLNEFVMGVQESSVTFGAEAKIRTFCRKSILRPHRRSSTPFTSQTLPFVLREIPVSSFQRSNDRSGQLTKTYPW